MKPSPLGEATELDLSAVARDLRAESAYERDGHTARTLVRDRKLRIVLIAMKPGAQLSEHRSQEAVSIQTIAGHVRITLPARVVELPAGRLVALAPALPHAVESTTESTVLLTLAWD
jgi:quercetin dioxygenase-like cupin family protein